MIAVDTNHLVYAHRRDSPWHERAALCIRELAEGTAAWAIPWPCIHEFLALATHERIFSPPSAMSKALEQVEAWLESPSVLLIAEGERYWSTLRELVAKAKITGPRVHDARIAALCISCSVRELWSADRNFSRFTALKTRNPLVAV